MFTHLSVILNMYVFPFSMKKKEILESSDFHWMNKTVEWFYKISSFVFSRWCIIKHIYNSAFVCCKREWYPHFVSESKSKMSLLWVFENVMTAPDSAELIKANSRVFEFDGSASGGHMLWARNFLDSSLSFVFFFCSTLSSPKFPSLFI